MTTGDSTLADQPNNSGSDGVDLGGGSVRGDTDFDVTIVKIDLAVPAGPNCLSLDFRFLTEEFPEFVGSNFNDAFIAELDSSTWTTSGSTISAPNNFAFDPSGDVISVNSSGVTSMTAGNASGTTYDGATPLLSAATPITAGAHSLYLSIFDQGDNILDSAVFVDNLILGSVGPGGCERGATVLSTSKTADSGTTPPGGANGYTITVSNPSASAVVLNSISDTLPSGFTYTAGSTTGATTADPAVSGQMLTWTGPFSAPAAGNVSLHFLVTVSSTAGEYFNDASADAGTTPVAPTGPTAKITVTSAGTELAITKADAPDPVALGGNLSYTLTVTNNGPDPSTDSTVTDALPPGVTFVSATPSQGACSEAAGTVSCTLGPLAVGASATIEIVVTVDATAVCPLSDTATVAGVETDPLPDNNSATAETACGGGTDLAITKADAPDPVAVGGSLTYTVTVTNNGPDPSTDSTVTDALPPGVTFVSATPSQGACSEAAGTVTCTLGPLAVGASATIQIVVTVEATALSPLSDTATVTGVETDPAAANNSATAETMISAPTELDHFKCYKAKNVGERFDPRHVILTDEFNTQRVNVVRPEAFCTPVDKDGSGINDPTAHLTCYKIHDVRGDEFPKFEKRRVDATDQFGTHSLLLKKIRSLCVPAAKSPAGQDPGPVPTELDHYKCYKAKQVGTKFEARRVLLTDQFNTERVNVVRPEAFCNPVDKDGSGIKDPAAHLTCYKIRDVRHDEFPKFEPRRVNARDQFGVRGLRVTKARRLCLPPPEPVHPPGPGACVDTDNNGNPDNDGDALCDNWETIGLDGDNDGVADLQLYDLNGDGTIDASEQADLNHKDIYLEIDFMELHQPDAGALADVIAAFAAAPVTNPAGGPGVTLHIQTDEQALLHSDELAFPPCTATAPAGVPDFDAVKAASFGTAAERGVGTQVTSAKRFAFHYSLFVHNLLGLDGTSGCAEIFGNDFVVSLGSWSSVGGHPVGTRDEQAGTLMHEFGHNLNLRHGGADDINCKPNYLSVMTYTRQINGAPISGRPLDYSRSALPTLDEASLSEPAGVAGPVGDQTAYGPPPRQVAPADAAIDWNRDSDTVDSGVSADINNVGIGGCAGAGTVLQGHDDWTNLRYDFQNSGDFADGVHLSVIGEREITFAEVQELRGID